MAILAISYNLFPNEHALIAVHNLQKPMSRLLQTGHYSGQQAVIVHNIARATVVGTPTFELVMRVRRFLPSKRPLMPLACVLIEVRFSHDLHIVTSKS